MKIKFDAIGCSLGFAFFIIAALATAILFIVLLSYI